MERSISDILKQHSDVESFRTAMTGLGKDLDYNAESFLEFGETYCTLYPEALTQSDSEGVVAGYRLVRICIIEILVSIIPENLQDYYRKMFTDVNSINSVLTDLEASVTGEEKMKIHLALEKLLNEVKFQIDLMPNGIPKERFIGGISVFFNILYLMKKKLKS